SNGGELRQHKPVIYQTACDGSRTLVSGGFKRLGRNEAGFSVGRYDHSRPMAIDPVIDSATFIGGIGEDQVIYSSGGITAGNTTSPDFPGAPAARRSGWKVFYRNGSSTLIVGGSGDDRLTAVIPAYPGPVMLGYTNSLDLATSAAA